MVKLYILVLALSLALFVGIQSEVFFRPVLYLNMLSGGRFVHVAANLWWVVVLIGPFAVLAARRRPYLGALLSGTLAAAVYLGPTLMLERERAALLPDNIDAAEGAALELGEPTSIEFVWGEGYGPEFVFCGDLCERLLSGGQIDWVRVKMQDGTGPNSQSSQSMIIETALGAACSKVYAGFDEGEPCILATPDDGRSADLRLLRAVSEDPKAEERSQGLHPYTFETRTAQLIDLRSEASAVLAEQSQVRYMTPTHLLPIYFDPSLNGIGIFGSDFVSQWTIDDSPTIDLVAMLDWSGVRLDKDGMSPQETDPIRAIIYAQQREPKAYDLPLLLSVLEITPEPTNPVIESVNRWVEPFLTDKVANEAEVTVLRQLDDRYPGRFRALDTLKSRHPEYFYNDISLLYREVEAGDEEASKAAAKVLHSMALRSNWAPQEGEADLFLHAYQTGRQQWYLLQIIGRFGFDPTPYLIAYLSEKPDEGYTVLSAACWSESDWPDTLGIFVRDTMIAMGRRTKPHGFANLDMKPGALALARMNRLDLLEEVREQIDWESALGSPRMKNWNMTAEELQHRVMSPDGPQC